MSTNLLSFGGKILTVGGNALSFSSVDPYNPLNLPPYTVRLEFTNGVTPTFSKGTGVQVSSSPNVWDLTYQDADWSELLRGQSDLIEVLGVNATNVTSTSRMFQECTALTSVPLFDTSAVTNMSHMFYNNTYLTSVPLFDTSAVTDMKWMCWNCSSITSLPLLDTSKVIDMRYMICGCTSLTTVPLFDTSSAQYLMYMLWGCTALTAIPLFDTSSAINMEYMCNSCTNVESGALALYQQASSQASVPGHTNTFWHCGSNTVTGAAELAQIPTSWGGTGA